MKSNIKINVFWVLSVLIFVWPPAASAYFTFVDGSQIRRCRTLDEIDTGPVLDPFHDCPLVEATTPPAASLSDPTITTEIDFVFTYEDILERWTIPGQEPIERFYEWGVGGFSQWFGPCPDRSGSCYFSPSESWTREMFPFRREPFTVENLGAWKYEEFIGDRLATEIEFEMKEIRLTEESTGSRIGIVNQNVETPLVFRLSTFEDEPDEPHPVAGESVSGTLTGPKGQKGAAIQGIGSSSKTDSSGFDSVTVRLGSKPGVYRLTLDTRWMLARPVFDFIAIDDLDDLDPEQEHPDVEQGVGEDKARGCDRVGNPVQLSIGNKFQREVDLQASGISPIEFVRYHNSLGFVSSSFSNYWTHTYDRRVEIPSNPQNDTVKVIRPDGRKIHFNWNGGRYEPAPGIFASLEQAGGGWVFTDEDMTIELFDIDGFLAEIKALNGVSQTANYNGNDQLARIDSSTGGSLDFTYDPNGRLSSVTDQAGRAWTYGYEILGRLHSVENPDGTSREYHYEDLRHPYALTGVTDERGLRYATYEYDEAGRAVASSHAGNADRVDIRYGENGERIVLDPLGNATIYQTRIENGRGILDGISGPACSQGCGLSDTHYFYDSDSNVTSQTSYGVTTQMGNYDLSGQPGYRIQAAGTPGERRVDYEYDPRFRNKITRMTEPSVFAGARKITERVFDDSGNLTRETVTGFDPDGHPVSRTTNNAFNGPFGQLTATDGPREDVNDTTHFEYYPDDASQGFNRGRLKAVIDPAGIRQRDSIQYTATGKILTEIHPNGVVVDYGYFGGNDRIRSITQSGGNEFNRTQWEYSPAGDVSVIIVDDEAGQEIITRMSYDSARRLVRTESRVSRTPAGTYYSYEVGQWESYEFDGAGNITYESHSSRDAPGEDIVIRKVFDEHSRIDTITRGGVTEDFNYHPNGTLGSRTDGNLNPTSYTYDDFKRLTSTEQVGQVVTQMTYDVHGNMATITDPENHTTSYEYDDLGNLLRQLSPDTAATSNTYNAAGQRVHSLDALGQVSSYTYDVSGRLLEIDRAGADYDVTYTYDDCLNGTGRLCSLQTGWGHEIRYGYNPLGETVSVANNEAEISYEFGPNGILNSIEYPSGRKVQFRNDGGGLPTGIALLAGDLTELILVENIRYSPLRRPVSWRLGNGQQVSIDLDARHRPVSIEVPEIWNWQAGAYDSNDNLLSLNTPAGVFSYSYDPQNRLASAATPDESISFSYDKVGNRLTRMSNGRVESGSYEFGGNRITGFGGLQYSLDANGNTLEEWNSPGGGKTFEYSSHNRLVAADDRQTGMPLARYGYDALGQRVIEETSSGTRKFVYGTSGELLAEIDGDGKILHEYVYLNGTLIADLFEIPPEGTPEPQPEIIVDSEGSGAEVTGRNWAVKSHSGAINGSYLQNRKFSGRTVRWYVDQPGFRQGYYDVFVKWMKSPRDGIVTRYRLLRLDEQGTSGYWTGVAVAHEGLEEGDWAFLGNFEFQETSQWGAYQGVYLMGDDNSSSQAGGTLKADAVRLVPTTDPKSLVNIRYIHTDHLGTPQVVTDSSGKIVWSAKYQPFGEAVVDEDPDGDQENYNLNLRFPGQYYNSETGLHYNYFRDYDPALGRYVESDPIGLDGGLNTFAYVMNRPMQLTDPFGLEITGSWIKQPRVIFTSYGLTGIELISPYIDNWGYLKSIGVSGYANGYVNLDVRCSDSGGCRARDWELHERINFSFSGTKDFGPNAVSVAAGSAAGPMVGSAVGVITFGASSLDALLGLLLEAQALGADKAQWLYAIGPTALCRGIR